MRAADVLRGRGWDVAALGAAAAGLLVASASGLPGAAALPLLGLFVLVGPGSLLQGMLRLPSPTRWLFVPTFGIAVVVVMTTAMAWFAVWQPRVSLALVAGLVAVVAGARLLPLLRGRVPAG
jgi:hypothetical protein